MIVKHLFGSLMDRLEGIEQEWMKSDKDGRKEKLFDEVMELRRVSDDILDHWLLFEEKMSQIQKRFQHVHLDQEDMELDLDQEMDQISDEVADKILAEIKKQSGLPQHSASGMVSFLSGDAVRSFRKGQGYYHLFMYPQAAQHFQEVVQLDPDLEIARMYLGFSEMMSGNWEEADRHFQLIGKTGNHGIIRATALNAQGCLLAGHQKWEQALTCFDRAIAAYPRLKDPIYNKALVYMKQGEFAEAKPLWVEYSKHCKDDWEALLHLAHCYIQEGNEEQAGIALKELTEAADDPEILWEAGKMFENLREFGNAAIVFRLLVSMDSDQAAAWHGLGWNLWHAEGLPTSLDYIKKAISMSPTHPDFQFSLGWILYQLQEYDQAEQIFQGILQQEGIYPLALAGLAHVYMDNEKWKEAEECCGCLISQDHKLTRALGYFQMGRLNLMKGNHTFAKQHFQQSIGESPQLIEGYLWLGLTHYLLGEQKEAFEMWEHTL